MVSDTPLPDRCAAEVRDKTGLEIELNTDSVISDEEISIVRLQSDDGVTTIDAVPNYEEVREYLWNDYSPLLIAVGADIDTLGDISATDDPVDADGSAGSPPTDRDELTWFEIGEFVENTSNRTSELRGYCERYPMTSEGTPDRCYNHQGGGAPEGNSNAMTHGLYAQRTSFYQALGDEDKAFVEAMVDSWLDQAPFDRDNVAMVNELYRAGIDQLRAWAGIDEYVEGGEIAGLTQEMTVLNDSGEEIEIEDEHPANMPYSRLDRDVRQKLKELNIYDSPDSKQADATESLAQKLSGLSDNDS